MTGVNEFWQRSKRGRAITLPARPLFDRSTKFFLIGSCFAMEIKNYLRDEAYIAAPDLAPISFDPACQNIDKLRQYNHVNHFDTFSMRQEFELGFGERTRRLADCMATSARGATGLFPGVATVEDCYRPYTYASSPEALMELALRIDRVFQASIVQADVIVCTLGLTEVWRRRHVDLLSSVPQPDSVFHRSSFEENLANVRRMVEMIRSTLPRTEIVLTVSPVPLVRTFTSDDVVVANMESKSILRAVVGEVCRSDPRIVYFPSYEIAQYHDVLEEDGRHVRREWTRRIFSAFLASCSRTASGVSVAEAR